jgi:hypothetical protein
MGPIVLSRKRSLSDMQHTDGAVPTEYNDSDYFREVLQLEDGLTEAVFDDALVQDAEAVGITISRPTTPADHDQNVAHNSMCESAATVGSHHARTFSSGSQGSDSTGITSRTSNEQSDNSARPHMRRRTMSKRTLSFSEYEKYLAHAEAQDNALRGFIPPPMPIEPAPSLFSVSTRRSIKSMKSIKKGIQRRFQFRRNNASQEDLK